MRQLYILFLVLIGGATVSCQTSGGNSSKQQISKDLLPTEFAEMTKSNPGVILDVRTLGEVRQGHLEGMKHMDIQEPDFTDRVSALDRGKPVYVYCAVGGRSANAAQRLKDLGFKEVYNLDGGIRAWRQKGLPLAK